MERGWRANIAGNGERLSLQGGCLIMEEYARDVLAAADDASVKIREVDFEG